MIQNIFLSHKVCDAASLHLFGNLLPTCGFSRHLWKLAWPPATVTHYSCHYLWSKCVQLSNGEQQFWTFAHPGLNLEALAGDCLYLQTRASVKLPLTQLAPFWDASLTLDRGQGPGYNLDRSQSITVWHTGTNNLLTFKPTGELVPKENSHRQVENMQTQNRRAPAGCQVWTHNLQALLTTPPPPLLF